MPTKILLIDNEQVLADRVSAALEAAGFEARVTGDGKDGLDLARDWSPRAIVLCVELPGMSGYLVCQKLKKDDVLRTLPLVLTSGEATQETFDKHRTLKARADDYLLKPYEPEELVARIRALVGDPEVEPAEVVHEEEELVNLEEEIGIGAAAGEPEAEIMGLDLSALPDVAPGPVGAGDEDLRLLDDAFDGISTPSAARDAQAALDELAGEKLLLGDDVDGVAASLPQGDEGAGPAALGGLDLEADAALGALGSVDETLSPGLRLTGPETEPLPERPPGVRGASAELLRAAGIKMLVEEAPPVRAPIVPPLPKPSFGDADPAKIARLEGELASRNEELDDLRRKAEAAGRRANDAEAEAGRAKERIDAALEKARKAEADLKGAREEARHAAEQARAAEGELSELRRRLADLEQRATAAEQETRRKAEEASAAAEALARAEALEREADELRTELLVARGEVEGARGEVEKRTADLRKRVAELEATNAKNEERVVRAYQKIKADEKVRDKVRKALAIATQLVDEGLPAESQAEKERRAASSGRE